MIKRSRRIELTSKERTRLLRAASVCRDAALRTRYLIVIHSADGWRRPEIAAALHCSLSTIGRVRNRWIEEGEAGLADRREDNGERKMNERYKEALVRMLQKTPRDFGCRRPTWTQRLMIEVLASRTGVRISRRSMGRLLKELDVRRGRPKPAAPCPWSERARKRRIKLLRQLIDTLPQDEAAVWEDEVDIDLNPRIGPDWMLRGTQRVVMTPGKNVKRYIAGAMDAQTGRVWWVRGERKNSSLFIDLLKRLRKAYPDKQCIHVILDNYIIHSSKRTRLWLRDFGQRFRLHFLPPYCPDDNRIERKMWRELHANVTYNHPHERIESLMDDVSMFLRRHNLRVARKTVPESCAAI